MKTFKKIFLAISFIGVFAFSGVALAQGTGTYDSDKGLVPCGGYKEDGSNQPDCDFEYMIIAAEGLIDFLLFTIAMPLAAIAFAYAGYLYLFSGISDQKKKAKGIFMNVLWGLVIALSAWLIINTLFTGLEVDDGTGEGEPDLIYLEP